MNTKFQSKKKMPVNKTYNVKSKLLNKMKKKLKEKMNYFNFVMNRQRN